VGAATPYPFRLLAEAVAHVAQEVRALPFGSRAHDDEPPVEHLGRGARNGRAHRRAHDRWHRWSMESVGMAGGLSRKDVVTIPSGYNPGAPMTQERAAPVC